MAAKTPVSVLFCLLFCACAEYDRAVPRFQDLRDAPGAYPPVTRGEALYRRMLSLSPLEVWEFSMRLSEPDQEEVARHILRTKGRESYWSWRFEVGWDVPPAERGLIDWYLREHTSYVPVSGPQAQEARYEDSHPRAHR